MDVGGATDGFDAAAYPVPDELRRHAALGRFPVATEPDYRRWLAGQVNPLVRISAGLAVPIWATSPLIGRSLVGAPLYPTVGVLCWGLALPTVLAAFLSTYTRLRRWAVEIGAATLLVVAFVSLYSFFAFPVYRSETGLLGSVIWLNLLALFVRAPFRTTCFVASAITALGSAFLIVSVHDLATPRREIWGLFSSLMVTVVMVPGMAYVNEQTMRRRYVDERVIQRQQEELVTSRALIRRYAPPAVIARLEQGDTSVGTAQRRRVTVFFADVVGFTDLADRLDPEALAEIVNEYLGSVSQIIEGHGGTLNEFAGDGVMALFGAPEDMEPREQVAAALAAGAELQRSLPEWSRRWYPLGIDQDLQARVGINTGVLSVGTFGSAVRATYTGIGLQTNIAARIQAQCPPGSMLLSKTSWHLVCDTVRCEPRGEVSVKGVHFPVAMYEPEAV